MFAQKIVYRKMSQIIKSILKKIFPLCSYRYLHRHRHRQTLNQTLSEKSKDSICFHYTLDDLIKTFFSILALNLNDFLKIFQVSCRLKVFQEDLIN